MNEPLYLPKGSIRAILAIMVVSAAFFLLYSKIITFEQFQAVLYPVMAIYFVVREKAK